jgi:hypothetical protein
LDNAETQLFLLEFVRRVNLSVEQQIVIDFEVDVSGGQLSVSLGAVVERSLIDSGVEDEDADQSKTAPIAGVTSMLPVTGTMKTARVRGKTDGDAQKGKRDTKLDRVQAEQGTGAKPEEDKPTQHKPGIPQIDVSDDLSSKTQDGDDESRAE